MMINMMDSAAEKATNIISYLKSQDPTDGHMHMHG